MIKEIKYNGFTETPSDYECPDGDLATVTGLVPEDEALHPVQDPIVQFSFINRYYTVVYIHHITGHKNYIIRYDYQGATKFYWIDEEHIPSNRLVRLEDFVNNLIIELASRTIYGINSIGNTFLVLTDNGTYYCLWKEDSNGYASLGNHLPEISLSFGLQGNAIMGRSFASVFDPPEAEGLPDSLDQSLALYDWNFNTDEARNAVTNIVLSQVNKFIADESTNKGKFIFPFMVRYAYRLYDQSLIMHSVPVLMITNSHKYTLQVLGHPFYNHIDDVYFATGWPEAIVYSLDYLATIPNGIADWKDIIESVDIFISAPLYTYNQAGKVEGWEDRRNTSWYTVGKLLSSTYADVANNNDHSKWPSKVFFNDDYGEVGNILVQSEYLLPRKSDEEFMKSVRDCHDFYLLKSIPIDKLATTRTVIEIPNDYLGTLVNREHMTDDYYSHDLLISKYSFTYNSRLHLANLSRKLRNTFAPLKATNLNEVAWSKPNAMSSWTSQGSADYDIYVFINQNGKEYVIKDEGQGLRTMSSDFPFVYYFYPDTNAYKAVIKRTKTGEETKYYELPLERHDFLNGAVYFEGWNNTPALTTAPTETTGNVVDMPNKMYTSEVNNPFLFLPLGVNTIGMSKIIGIRPVVEAVSPSQYGQYKFYVFAGDGVWAMEVSSTGYLESPQIVVPDVVVGNGESITQIDGAVLFASDRGIMLVKGSTCICISDILNSEKPFMPFATLAANDLLRGLRNVIDEDEIDQQEAMVPFRTFVKKCQMLYDYPHQRVLVWNPDLPYAYVYSLKSKEWGMIASEITSTVNGYPAAYAMVTRLIDDVRKNILIDYASDHNLQELTQVSGMLITRPLKLDLPDVLKTVDSVVQRGQFRKGHVKSILYGSRDMYNWQPIWSSVDHYLRGFSGTPYKYFRIALTFELERDESIMGCTIQFTPRYQNRLR